MKKFILTPIVLSFLTLLLHIMSANAQVICTIDNTNTYSVIPTLSSGAAYKNFTDAISQLNAASITTPVIFNVTAGQTFNETALLIIAKSGTASNTITFQKNGNGANPVIIPAAGTSTADAIVKIAAASYITFDGIDLSENSNNALGNEAMEMGYALTNNSSTVASPTHNTIKNATVTLNRSNINLTYGVYQFKGATATVAASGNIYENIVVTNSFYGIYLTSSNTSLFDDGNVIRNCTVGAASADDIGNNSTFASAVYGIFCNYQSNISVYNCEVRNVTATLATAAVEVHGLYFRVSGTSNIYNDKVHDIKNNCVTGSTAIASGMLVFNTGTTDVTNVYNNFISGIYNGDNWSTSTTSSSMKIIGIYIYSGSLGTTNVYHNSVFLQGSTGNVRFGSADLYTAATANTLNILNNIFKNSYTPSGLGSFGLYITTHATVNTCDYNNYDITTSTTRFTGGIGAVTSPTKYQYLADWASATGRDLHSKQFSTDFTSLVAGSEDLHLNVSTTNHSYDGIPLPLVTTDIDGDARSTVVPYIGADEVVNYTLPLKFVGLSAFRVAKGIQLQWKVAYEDDVKEYQVERSDNGAQFQTVTTTLAQNVNVYNWLDGAPLSGKNYYRIKAVDNDGAFTFSDVTSANAAQVSSSLVIYPNPVIGSAVNVKLAGLAQDNYSLIVVESGSGRQVYQQELGNMQGDKSVSIALNKGLKGVYIVLVKGSKATLTQTIIVP